MPDRVRNYKFYGLNFHIQSDTGTAPSGYEKLFAAIVNSRTPIRVRGDRYVLIRTAFKSRSGTTVFYEGQISKFTKIETDDWLNLDSMEVENVVIPPNRFPNLVETDYVFVPALHRLALLSSPGVSPANVLQFFQSASELNKTFGANFYVSLEQAADGFDRILKAKEIRKLHIETTPTNDDITEEAAEFMDRELKEMGAGRIEMDVRPNDGKRLSIASKVLNGSLGLARSNGHVQAVVLNEDERRETIRTESYPREFRVKATSLEAAKQSIVELLFGVFRRGR